jgi:hypothetical protein
MDEFTYKDGAQVWIRNLIPGRHLKGTVRGSATTPMYGIGRMYIVEVPEIKSETYPYSFVTVPENSLEERIIIKGD